MNNGPGTRAGLGAYQIKRGVLNVRYWRGAGRGEWGGRERRKERGG